MQYFVFMFAIVELGAILTLYNQLHLWITTLYVFNWILHEECIIRFLTIVFCKNVDIECYTKVLVFYDPSIFIRNVNWRDLCGRQYDDDADTAAYKNFEALMSKSSSRFKRKENCALQLSSLLLDCVVWYE